MNDEDIKNLGDELAEAIANAFIAGEQANIAFREAVDRFFKPLMHLFLHDKRTFKIKIKYGRPVKRQRRIYKKRYRRDD
jgi:hypothetical protein